MVIQNWEDSTDSQPRWPNLASPSAKSATEPTDSESQIADRLASGPQECQYEKLSVILFVNDSMRFNIQPQVQKRQAGH